MAAQNWNPVQMFSVRSSSGTLWAERNTGNVINREYDSEQENVFFDQVERFDIEEYKKHYSVADLPESIDILDLGGWMLDGAYDSAAKDWREEVAILRAGGEL